jgi:pimeloyl-ACP methyl ester carboxylesterase
MKASNGTVELDYTVDGAETDPVVVLISGWAASRAWWDHRFVAALVAEGLRVVRFDNRDTGQSSRLDGLYELEDMAADTAAVIDAVGVDRAHLVGVSMGGMIAQAATIGFPDKVASLTSLMSLPKSTSDVGPQDPALAELGTVSYPTTRDEHIALEELGNRLTGSKGLPIDWDAVRARAGEDWDRGRDLHGSLRQLNAIGTCADRTEALGNVAAPTLVIHGTDDILVRLPFGEATAKAVPGAHYLVIDGMGHDLPPAAWPQVIPAIVLNVRAGER